MGAKPLDDFHARGDCAAVSRVWEAISGRYTKGAEISEAVTQIVERLAALAAAGDALADAVEERLGLVSDVEIAVHPYARAWKAVQGWREARRGGA
jgi:predicted component of type VI protein secretion system